MDSGARQRLAEVAARAMERLGVPGVAMGVLHGGEAWTTCAGVTSVENPLPVDERTLFQAGSISKTVTATAAMRLVEAGKLELGERVRRYLPAFRLQDEDAAERATVTHLFNHTGGWVGDYFRDTGKGDDAIERIVAKMANSPQLTPLGATWSYNNAGFYVAGRLIEVLAGKPYETVAREMVFEPLGMGHTYFQHDDLVPHRVASGHVVTADGPRVAHPWAMFRNTAPVGSVTTCITDLLAYARFHLGDGRSAGGERVLSGTSLRTLHTATAEAGTFADATAIAWHLRDVGGVPTVQHGGSTNGQQASLILVPSKQFAVAVLTNADKGREAHETIMAEALDAFAGVRDPEPQAIAFPPARLAEYEGGYSAVLSDVRVSPSGTGLLLTELRSADRAVADSRLQPLPVPAVRLAFTAADRVVALDSPYRGHRAEFLRDASGRIEWFRWGGRIARRQA
jgi:CubicO group peptidase (beta-lactamase class C family)